MWQSSILLFTCSQVPYFYDGGSPGVLYIAESPSILPFKTVLSQAVSHVLGIRVLPLDDLFTGSLESLPAILDALLEGGNSSAGEYHH